MDWARILAYVTGTVDQELLGRNEHLAAENRIMKGEGPVERAAEAVGRRRGNCARAGLRPPKRPLDFRSFPSAITSSPTLIGVDGRPEILLYSKGFGAVDQTSETGDTAIFGL